MGVRYVYLSISYANASSDAALIVLFDDFPAFGNILTPVLSSSEEVKVVTASVPVTFFALSHSVSVKGNHEESS